MYDFRAVFSRIFDKNVKLLTGRKFPYVGSRFCFFITGVITDDFHWDGKIPVERDLLTMHVIGSIIWSTICLRMLVGTGSIAHDLEEEDVIIFFILSWEKREKLSKQVPYYLDEDLEGLFFR